MRRKILSILPIIFIIVFTLIGSLILPKRVQLPNENMSTTKNNNNHKKTDQDSEEEVKRTPAIEILNEKSPLVIIDASHSPFGIEGKDVQDETKGEKLLKAESYIYEYEVTYELASAITKELENTNIEVIVLQERNKEKICLARQMDPDMVVTIHIHKTPIKKSKVYYKKDSKGKYIVQKMFNQANKSFKLEGKKAEKGSLLKSVDQAFMLEYSSPENITNSWIRKKAKELSIEIENYFL